MALIPIVERAAIPTGIGLGVPPSTALLLGIAGNLVPVVPLLLFLEPVSRWLSEKFAFFQSLFDWLYRYTRKKHSKRIDRYGIFGIFIVAAIPAPGMGPWSGSLVAFIFGASFWPSFLAIIAGTIVAASLLLAGSLGFLALNQLYNPVISAVIITVLAAIAYMFRRNQRA